MMDSQKAEDLRYYEVFFTEGPPPEDMGMTDEENFNEKMAVSHTVIVRANENPCLTIEGVHGQKIFRENLECFKNYRNPVIWYTTDWGDMIPNNASSADNYNEAGVYPVFRWDNPWPPKPVVNKPKFYGLSVKELREKLCRIIVPSSITAKYKRGMPGWEIESAFLHSNETLHIAASPDGEASEPVTCAVPATYYPDSRYECTVIRFYAGKAIAREPSFLSPTREYRTARDLLSLFENRAKVPVKDDWPVFVTMTDGTTFEVKDARLRPGANGRGELLLSGVSAV